MKKKTLRRPHTLEVHLRRAPVTQLLYINVQWFRGGLVCKAHRLLYHSTLGLRAIKKKKKYQRHDWTSEKLSLTAWMSTRHASFTAHVVCLEPRI